MGKSFGMAVVKSNAFAKQETDAIFSLVKSVETNITYDISNDGFSRSSVNQFASGAHVLASMTFDEVGV